MKQWWQGLNPREQKLVSVMAIGLSILLFMFLVWQPLNANIEKSRAKLAKHQDLQVWVANKTALYKQLSKSGGVKRSSGSLSSVINSSAKQRRIAIARMQPQGESLQVWIDEVPFNDFVKWLDHLAMQEGLKVDAADLAVGDKEGTVKVRKLQFSKA